MSKYYLGVMSGTSADGIDIALVDFNHAPKLLAHGFYPFSEQLQQKIISLYLPGDNEIDQQGELGIKLASSYHQAIEAFISKQQISKADIVAIGNHGQTIRHRPDFDLPFTMQIGCNQTLSALLNMRVIGDFRTKDVAYGGQGAPLVPAFQQVLFSTANSDTFIVNLGGIANITYLPSNHEKAVLGFDTGPANALMDEWTQKHLRKPFDEHGQWASSGNASDVLLNQLLSDPYFQKAAPKSTGREYFNLEWLENHSEFQKLSAEDIQATLLSLTATSISNAIKKISPSGYIYLCGGGASNTALHLAIENNLPDFTFKKLSEQNLDNDAFEAMAFAWLAYAFDKKIPSNIPSVTGASKQATLGVEFTS